MLWIIDLHQRCVVHDVEYKCWTFYWLQLLKLCRFSFIYWKYSDEYSLNINDFKNNQDNEYLSVDKSIKIIKDELQKLALLSKKHHICDISYDGTSVLLGWNVTSRERFIVTKDVKMEDIIEVKQDEIAPCLALNDDLELVTFCRSDERGYINEICIYNHQSKCILL